MEKSVFDKFTGKYELSKTLRFELKPIWNTPDMLNAELVVENDELRRKKYEAVKPWLDQLHREFIQDSLGDFRFKNLKTYQSALELWQKDKKSKQSKESLIKIENELREEISDCFEKTANKWATSDQYKSLGLKKDGIDMLFEAGMFKLLKKRFKNEKEIQLGNKNIFDDWNGWTGYFKKFFETRKNFYKANDTSTAIAYRIVNQNLRRFCENMNAFKKSRNKIDFSGVEKNFGIKCADIFSLENYNKYLLQEGIDFYNKIIGGELRGKDEKIQGINEFINKYRQDNHDNSEEKISFLKILDKQIHSEKEAFIDNIETDKEFFEKLEVFYKNADKKIQIFKKLINDILHDYFSYVLDKIYLSKEAVTHNANRWFSDYEIFERDLFAIVSEKQNKQEYELLRMHKNDSKISDKDGVLSFPDFIKCSHIKQALEKQEGKIWKEKYYDKKIGIEHFEEIKDAFKQFLSVFKFELKRQFSREATDTKTGKQAEVGYDKFSESIKKIIQKKDSQNINAQIKIDVKNFADTVLDIYRMAKYFAVEKRRNWLENYDLDDRFYKSFDFGYLNFYQDAFEQIVGPYNLFRNYLTKKPYSTNKWKLNFENQTLADGWDKNKEKDNAAVIFRKDGRYYLGIIHRYHKNIFTEKYREMFGGEDYGKMAYKQIANPSFDIHNLVLLKNGSVRRFTKMENKIKNWPKEIIRIKEEKSYAKENFNRSDFKTFIDYMKKCAIGYWKEFVFSFSPTDSYNNINDFTKEIENVGYKVSFDELVSERYLRDKNQKGELFLFEIHNKDWNLNGGKKKTGAKNLHTLYFEHLFNDDNARNNFVFKLNGEAELFFRPATNIDKLGYREKNGKVLINKKGKKVIKNFRYSKDKILFHCPITVNRVSENKTEFEMNADIRETICNNPDVNIIGVDRGEKNLIYYSIINQLGKILNDEISSLNSIGEDSKGKPVEYAIKLEKRAQEREASRRDWADVEKIKDIKQGYISQAVRKLADLIIKHNAIIVMEDLNMRFKQIRGGFEKSVYQQLEKALIDKLSFLVKKREKDPRQAGHILKAYQLTAPVKAFKDMGKQTGIIFYTQAGYTSKTCPKCGYKRNIKCRFENIEQATKFIENIDLIDYNKNEDSFTISYSLNKLLSDKKENKKSSNELYEKMPKKDYFTLSTKKAKRYKWRDRYSEKAKMARRGINEYKGELKENETKKGIVKEFNITEYMKGLLEMVGIDYKHGDIKQQILSFQRKREFYQDFLYSLFLLTETRHSISGENIDYIQCPVCCFDSRKGFQGKEYNGDANGAYNIARKGIMILEKIKQFKDKNGGLDKMGWGDLVINIEEWDKFTQK